ncbi:MAG: histidine phosphatase family protein [Rhodospirillales bacterium]|nr:histidine phosphatase family protein [Rhodospirillales bacterium]MBO6787042.1 histidine phosphatase family protein [Rhodospirillales bacterium]
MRHATAPGTGDPDNFKIGDCSTQRNLNNAGAKEAQAIGRAIKAGGIKSAKIYSSQWCRCLDTASQLNLGPVTELPALNSFYQRYDTKMVNMRALRRFIAENARSSEPIILVTHQVTISALTGQFTRQGETIIFRHIGGGEVEVVGSIPPT